MTSTTRPVLLALTCIPYFAFLPLIHFLSPNFLGISPWAIDLIAFGILPCLVLYFAFKKCGLSTQTLGLHGVTSVKALSELALWSTFLAILLLCVNSFGVTFLSFITNENLELIVREPSHLHNARGFPRYLIIGYLALTAGIVEEIFYRAIIKEIIYGLVKKWRKTIFIAVSTLLFSLAHWGLGIVHFGTAIYVGVFMSTMYAYKHDLRPLIVAHTFLNLYSYSHL